MPVTKQHQSLTNVWNPQKRHGVAGNSRKVWQNPQINMAGAKLPAVYQELWKFSEHLLSTNAVHEIGVSS